MQSTRPPQGPRSEDWQKVEGRIVLKDGREVVYRRARRDDEDALCQMFSALTEESLYLRYVGYHRATREEIREVLEKEGTEEICLVATPAGRENEIVAQIRCIFLNPPTNAELAIVVRDDWQNQGLGTGLVTAIARWAIQAEIERIVGVVGLSNSRMAHVFSKLGFATRDSCYDTVRMARLLPASSRRGHHN